MAQTYEDALLLHGRCLYDSILSEEKLGQGRSLVDIAMPRLCSTSAACRTSKYLALPGKGKAQVWD